MRFHQNIMMVFCPFFFAVKTNMSINANRKTWKLIKVKMYVANPGFIYFQSTIINMNAHFLGVLLLQKVGAAAPTTIYHMTMRKTSTLTFNNCCQYLTTVVDITFYVSSTCATAFFYTTLQCNNTQKKSFLCPEFSN